MAVFADTFCNVRAIIPAATKAAEAGSGDPVTWSDSDTDRVLPLVEQQTEGSVVIGREPAHHAAYTLRALCSQ